MYLHSGGIISETDLPWCYLCCTLLKFYWHKTGLKTRQIRSSNSFCRSWAALLCYPPFQSIKYVWIRQFLLSHSIETILLTPASIKICNDFWTKVELWVRTQVGLWVKNYMTMFVGERVNLVSLVLLKLMAKSNSSKTIRKNNLHTENKLILH